MPTILGWDIPDVDWTTTIVVFVFVSYITQSGQRLFRKFCEYIGLKSYFEARSIPQIPPKAICRSLWDFLVYNHHPHDNAEAGYYKYPNSKFSGYYAFGRETYLIHDPKLIKRMFEIHGMHFSVRETVIPERFDSLLSGMLYYMGSDRWLQHRCSLEYAFRDTHLKGMVNLLNDFVGKSFTNIASKRGHHTIELEMKDFLERLMNDATADIVFGIKTDSINNTENRLLEINRLLVAKAAPTSFKIRLYQLFPKWITRFRLSLTPKSIMDYYISIVKDVMSGRIERGGIRPDFINMFIKTKVAGLQYDTLVRPGGYLATSKREFNVAEIAAMMAMFFCGSLGSTISVLCFTIYELAQNSSIQQQLRTEIQAALKTDLAGFDMLRSMTYLDMVVSEGLRKWPPIRVMNRRCVKKYTLDVFRNITVEPGKVLQIPIYAIQNDAKYFKDPSKFDPARFSKKKTSIDAYMPFGVGVKMCLGHELAVLQMKCILFHILQYYEIMPSEKMHEPLEVCNVSGRSAVKGGFWFKLQPIVSGGTL